MGGRARWVAVALALAAPAPARAQTYPGGTVRCGPATPSTPLVVALHSGGFVLAASQPELERLCRPFARAGLRAVAYQYPTGDWARAFRAVRGLVRRARRHHPVVYGYGESSGGNLVEMLAVRGALDAAVADAGIADMSAWQPDNADFWRNRLPMTPAQRPAASPLLHVTTPAPMLLLHSPGDQIVPFEQSRELADATGATLQPLTGDHLEDATAVDTAGRWLQARGT